MKTILHPTRVGIIGCGGYARQLIMRMRTLPRHIDVVAATSRNPQSEAARYSAGEGVKIFQTIDDLLDFGVGKLDVILNPTPINIHRPSTLRCLEAGLPVWLEKPPVSTVAELDELVAAAKKTRLSIDVCFNSIYGQNVQQLKAELVAGHYGAVRRVRGIAGWIRDSSYFNRVNWSGKLKIGDDWIFDGTINNPLAHLICNNLYFAADEHHALAEIDKVEAHLWHGNDIESEDTSALRIHTHNGVEVLSHLTLCPEETIHPTTVVDTEKATLTLANFETVRIDWHDGRVEQRASYKENRIEMLEELSIRYQSKQPSLCPLALCRPFVETVEKSFRQVLEREKGCIPAIHPELIHRFPIGEAVATEIRGINLAMKSAHDAGQLMKTFQPYTAEVETVEPK
jgi:predicted dehydrogenase